MRELCNTPNVFIVAHGSLAGGPFPSFFFNAFKSSFDDCFEILHDLVFVSSSVRWIVDASYIDHESNEDHTKHDYISDDDEEEEGDEECRLIKLSAEEKKPIREPWRQTSTIKVTGRKTGDLKVSNEDHTKHDYISDDDEEEEGDEECPLIKLSAEEKKPIREP
ncbi:hypothetical protein NC651_027847 [Populus alba x Populus x berolinensis]|nr:hypothetical protein NC651_027847 [Populus alba x Populus x berolinensis]